MKTTTTETTVEILSVDGTTARERVTFRDGRSHVQYRNLSLSDIDAARSANRKPNGTIANIALDRRLVAAERALCISLLGMAPEDGTADGRYAYTNAEFRRDLAKSAVM